MWHALCLCVADQVHLSPPSPGSLGHVPVCRWTRLGHGVVPHAWHSPGDPVHRSGLPSRHGWPALCQQSVHRSWTGSAVGCGQSEVQQQVLVEHQPVEFRKSSVSECVWLLMNHCAAFGVQSKLPAHLGLRSGPGQRLYLGSEMVSCRGLGAPQLFHKGMSLSEPLLQGSVWNE